MILDEKEIEFFKQIAHEQYAVLVTDDYGEDGSKKLLLLTDAITKIYKHLDFPSFTKIIIYTPLDQSLSLKNIEGSNYQLYQSFQNLSQLRGTALTIEVCENWDLLISEFIMRQRQYQKDMKTPIVLFLTTKDIWTI